MFKWFKRFEFYDDPKFWRRLAYVLIISNVVMFLSWVIAMVTINTSMQVLNLLEKLLSIVD